MLKDNLTCILGKMGIEGSPFVLYYIAVWDWVYGTVYFLYPPLNFVDLISAVKGVCCCVFTYVKVLLIYFAENFLKIHRSAIIFSQWSSNCSLK